MSTASAAQKPGEAKCLVLFHFLTSSAVEFVLIESCRLEKTLQLIYDAIFL